MSCRRWISVPALFITGTLWISNRTSFNWIVDNFDSLLMVSAIAAFFLVLIWAVFRQVPDPATRAPDVAYLGPVALSSGAKCLVCRYSLSDEVIYCGRCHTPHHRACFTYIGGCSLFACAGRKAA